MKWNAHELFRRVFVFACPLLAVGGLALAQANAQPQGSLRFYIGTYTGASGSKGIYISSLDTTSGALAAPELVAEVEQPSFLALHPKGGYLYAVTETQGFHGENSGAVTAFAIDAETGKLRQLNQVPSQGAAPCHLVVDATGRHVLVANYSGGNVASFPIREDGSLGPAHAVIQHEGASVNRDRQQAPHAHSINLDPSNQYAVAADLGVDKVFVYRFNPENGDLTPLPDRAAVLEPGSGPRHFAFHPDGKRAFVINELLCTVTAFNFDPATGSLVKTQTISTLPSEVQPGFSTAEIVVSPNGRWVYGSNRGHDSIAVFSLSDAGELQRVENEPTLGRTPRNFAVDPTGAFLLAENQSTGNIVVFRIDQETGALSPAGHQVLVPSPVCIRFAPR